MVKADDLTTEQLLRRELAMLKSTHAPAIFFEAVCTFGTRNGVCFITLDTGESTTVDGAVLSHIRTVAHLRFPITAIRSIREALSAIEDLFRVVPQALKN